MSANTFFHEVHQELDAKLVPCGKWNLPATYPGGAVAEHRHTVESASLFDMSGTGCFQLTGRKCGEVLDKIFVHKVSALPVGKMMENMLLHETGNFSAVFTLNRMQEEDFMLHLDSNTPDKERIFLLGCLQKNGITVRDLSGAMAMLALIGPEAENILKSAGAEELPGKNEWKMISICDEEGDNFRAIAICHDRFGLPGFDFCVNPDNAVEFYGAIYRINGIAPAGLRAWESLRLESGTPGVPGELHDGVTPAECGFEMPPGTKSLKSVLVMVEADRHPALPGSTVNINGEIPAGVITSAAYCPVAGKARMFCRMELSALEAAGDKVTIRVNGESLDAQLLEKFR